MVSYRCLNKSTIKNNYSLPIFHELVDQLNGAKKLSNFDLRSEYNQVRIKEYDIENMAFHSRFGHDEYLVYRFDIPMHLPYL